MCRLAAFNAGIKQNDAIDILVDMQGKNEDGVGECHIENGKFVINKYPDSLEKILKHRSTKKTFLKHLSKPNGWTIVHMRGASPGMSICKSNTHPWNAGNFAVCHNGFWKEHNLPRIILKKFVKFHGSTDSETAAHLINLIGPKKFSDTMEWGNGVFLALNRNGHLWAIKTSGDLVIANTGNGHIFLASELPHDSAWQNEEADRGWYHFDEHGVYIKHKEKDWTTYKKSTRPSIMPPHTGAYTNLFSSVGPDAWQMAQRNQLLKTKSRPYVPDDGQPFINFHADIDERFGI